MTSAMGACSRNVSKSPAATMAFVLAGIRPQIYQLVQIAGGIGTLLLAGNDGDQIDLSVPVPGQLIGHQQCEVKIGQIETDRPVGALFAQPDIDDLFATQRSVRVIHIEDHAEIRFRQPCRQ